MNFKVASHEVSLYARHSYNEHGAARNTLAFQGVTVKPEFVVAHRELCVYGRVKGSKHLLMTERDVFYHCDVTCILPRHGATENAGLENGGPVLQGWKTRDNRLWNAKCIFRILYIWKSNRMTLFCNLFMERPS